MKISIRCKLFFFKSCLWKSRRGKICPFCWTKMSTWTFERNFFQHLTLFEVFNSNSDCFWISSIKIRHFVKLLIQNMTRCGILDSKPHTFQTFWFKTWHVVKKPCSKIDMCQNFPIEIWTVVYILFHSLEDSICLVSDYDTCWNFQVKTWQMVNFSFQDFTRCKTFKAEPDRFWFCSWQFWHNAHCFFQKNAFEKARRGQKMSILLNKKIHENFWKKFFPEPDTFWSFQLKIWLFLISIYQNHPLCKNFVSKSDKIWNFWLKIWHVVNFLLQGQTHCIYPKSKPDKWKKFWRKTWHVVNFLLQGQTHCNYPKSKPDRWKKPWSKIWQVLKFVNQSMTRCDFFVQNLTRCNFFVPKCDTWWNFRVNTWHALNFMVHNMAGFKKRCSKIDMW